MKKILSLILTIALPCANILFAQHLFSVKYNDLSNEKMAVLKEQVASLDISTLSLIKNNENKNVYSIDLAPNNDIIIWNEQTGSNVVITPAKKTIAELQLETFFIEELIQSVLGEATRYLIVEVNQEDWINHVVSISVSEDNAFLPQYFYGKKENVKEALPCDRQIINIYKATPNFIPAFPDDLDNHKYIEQLAEEMNYYIYMYRLPDGTLCIHDPHFNLNPAKARNTIGYFLKFNLYGTLNAKQLLATEYALELWSEQLAGPVPVDIAVDFFPMGQGVLGMSFFPECFLNTENHIWYPAALWNQMVGYNASGGGDINIWMNSEYSFYFDLDGNSTGIDYVTIGLHEATHGLGFGSQCSYEDGEFFYGEYPVIYDCLLYEGTNGSCFTTLTPQQRSALLVSNNLYAGQPGSNLLEANGGARVKMFAPSTYRPGSTAHHWDNGMSFSNFMQYAYQYPLHTFNNRKIGLMKDLGWLQPEIDPNAIWVTYNNNGGLGDKLPQPFLSGEAQNLKINNFSKVGYSCTNWNTASDGTGTFYSDRESVTIFNDMELFAQWVANKYTLKFYTNGGEVNPTSKQVTFDNPIGELPVPVKEGYKFNGWKIGSIDITEETVWKFVSERTAFAQWTQITDMEELEQNISLQIFPNPANRSIEFRINNPNLLVEGIEAFDIYGRKIISNPISNISNLISLDISHWNTGSYLLILKTNIGYISRKFFKY